MPKIKPKRKSPPSRGDFLERAFIVAMRQRWHYRGYETRDKAITSLRRFSGFSCKRCSNALLKGDRLYNLTKKLLKRHYAAAMTAMENHDRPPHRLMVELTRLAPGFRRSTHHQAMAWVLYWDFLR
jgi:hypothetical protein